MEYTRILYLLLSLVLFEQYFILKKYKSIVLNIITSVYIIILPFYCFVYTPNQRFDGNFMPFVVALIFLLILLLTPYNLLKLSITKEIKKYPFYGVGWLLFFVLYIVLGKVIP